MKYSVAAVLAAATGAVATYKHDNATVVTEVVESYVTYCPEPTEIVHGDKTYTVTEATTLTITDCPCTVTKPVIPTSTVVCHDCPTYVPPPPPHSNQTHPAPVPTEVVPPPGGEPEQPEQPEEPTPAPTAGAAKVAGLSGVAGLAALAFFL